MPNNYIFIQNLPLAIPKDSDKVVMVVEGEARTGLAGNLKDKDLRTEVENARNGQLTLSNRLSNMEQATTNEVTRAQNAETNLTTDIASESNRAQDAENTINNIITANKPIWDDKYTKTETDNKIAAVVSGLDWKEGVHAYADLATTYPTPQKGWTVAVEVGLNNSPTYYRWNGTEWEDVGLEAIPKATSSNDGLMTKEYASKLDGIVNVKPTNYIYVGKNGNDNNDGSANKPYLTVQKAIDIATSGTAIFIFPGTYSENLTFKANVYLTCATKFTTTITGNHIIDLNGTAICENILFNSNSGNTLSFQGTNSQNFQLIGSSVYSNGGDAINWTNTNASSKILFEDGTVNVTSSGASARAFYSNSTAKGSFILNRVSCKVDTLNNVCLAIGGSLNVSYTADQIIGQVVMSDTATATFGNLSMTTTSVPVTITNSSGMTTLASVIVNTTSSPIVSGVGAFSFVAILYANAGVGGASTLNGGYGPIALQMASIKLRNSSLLPSGAIAAGLVNGEFEYDGTDLYFTKGNVRYVVAMGDVKGYLKVDSLPTSNIKTGYIYLLTTDKSINVYDGTAWSTYGGGGLSPEQLTKLNDLDLNYLGNNVKNNGAIGDNVADDTNAIQNTINLGNTVIAPSGTYKITSIDNKYGKSFVGDGKILKNSVLQNSYADKYQNIFGREYMSYAHKRVMNGQALNIVFSGDSTTFGDSIADSNYKIYNLISILSTKAGFTNVTTVNNGHSGMTTGDWNTTYVNTDLSSAPDILVLRWGVNDAGLGVTEFVTSLRSGLTKIRTSRPLNNLSIILMTPNSTSDSVGRRDELWYEQINPAIKQACRDFQCAFIDTYQYLQDSRNASDYMDNPYGDGRHIHPLEVMNLWISSKIIDVIFPLSIRLKFGSTGGGSISDATSTNKGIIKLAGDLSGTSDSPVINSLKGAQIDITNFEDNNVMIVDKTNNKLKLMPIGSAVTVGSVTLIQPPPIITLTTGEEGFITVEQNSKVVGVEEQINGTTINDLSTMDFSNANKYIQQDNTKTLINNKVTIASSGYSSDITPNLTSNTSASPFIVSASSIYSSTYDVWHLFNKSLTQNWISANGVTTGIITIDFGSSNTKPVVKYQVRARTDAQDYGLSPKTWTFEGSNNGTTWTILDTRTNETGWINGGELRSYLINSPQYFRYFRMNITANNGYSYVSFTSLILMTPTYYNNIYSYVSTSNVSNLSLSNVDKINYITIPIDTPTNTSIKFLFSVDKRNNWLYKDGTEIHKFTGDLTTSWTNYNSNTDLQTYFTNLTITQLITDLSSLSIIPTTLDIICLPFTSDNTVTPTVYPIIINYSTKQHNEMSTFGRYDDNNVTFGMQWINSTTLGIKNHTTSTRTAQVNAVKGV
ncbi:GDSL-type esterase/lipase family protein [Clostridium saccharoperbutylacetonicum]|uniref:GDSL-type esterase/lipase family protein n=1 Tax=Clostridium saccharoperbutylacetonicum TaxID=36745 RepID=UPI0039EB969A